MKYDLRRTGTRTSGSATLTILDSFTVVNLPWYKRLWSWLR